MRVAIVHDELMRKGGAEQVVLTMLKAFPNADLFTLAYNPEGTYPEYKNYKINTSKLQFLSRSVKWMQRLYFPLGVWAMKSLKVHGYDVVLISNTHSAKYVDIDNDALVFIYTYTPFRLAWEPTSYSQYVESRGVYRWVFDKVINYLREIDRKEAQKGDFYLGMTKETAQRIRDAYQVEDVTIIAPDVKTVNFKLSDKEKKYYLVVSRLEYYKKTDLAIEAFNELGLPLIVVGSGTKADELKRLAKPNIQFRSGLTSEELADLYANCKALIFPQYEDYGITPLEAIASGRPVIAYERGGVLETMIPYRGDASKATAVFFKEQTIESLKGAIELFQSLNFDPEFIKAHAEKFDEYVFIDKIKQFVTDKYRKSRQKSSPKPKLASEKRINS